MLDKDAPNVGRVVREEVARIRVVPDATARQLHRKAVDAPGSIRVDESPNELLRVAMGDLALPALELDPALVLPACGAARLQYNHRSAVADVPRHPRWMDSCHRHGALSEDPVVRGIERHSQGPGAPKGPGPSITEVDPDEVCVGSVVQRPMQGRR